MSLLKLIGEIIMNDRELLELAARVLGVQHVDYSGVDYDGSFGLVLVNENGSHVGCGRRSPMMAMHFA